MTGVSKGEILLYKTEDGQTKLDVRLEDETVWLTQTQLAVLFAKTKQSISLHINNVYKEGELPRDGTVKEYLTVQKEGNREVKRKIEFYNLYRPDGSKRIGDNALVALTLMIAESRSEEKDVMTKVIVNLINRKN